jgi:hypothetical protein
MSGDVQGDTSRVISNQAGADINTDGNDTKILVEDGAEKQTDNADEIKTISNAQYKSLSEEEQKQYVRYNPSLQSMAFSEYLALQNQLVNGFNTLGPAIDKMSVLSNITFLSSIASELQTVGAAFKSAADTIKSLESVEIIGTLAKPVTSVVKMVGSLCALIVVSMTNPYNQLMAYKDAFEQIDFTEYKKLFESTPDTPSISEQLALKQSEMSKIHIPSEEIKNKYNEQIAAVNSQITEIQNAYNSIQVVDSLLSSLEAVQTTLDASTAVISFGSTTALQQAYKAGYEAAKESYSEDYTKKAQNMAKDINDFSSKLPIEWIKISDLEKLKQMEDKQS